MTIKALRILPPFAIGRLGSASEPLDNYTIKDDPDNPLAFRHIVPAKTLIVDEASGEITGTRVPSSLQFKHEGRIRPVAPFLEVFALDDHDGLVPLTMDLLQRHGMDGAKISWRVTVANRKVVRRTSDAKDLVLARTDWFSSHERQPLKGHCENFVSDDAFVDFGHARYIKPNDKFPEIRLRFTPARGFIYGPKLETPDPMIPAPRAIYDTKKGRWYGFGADTNEDAGESAIFQNETVPPSLYAIVPPAPSWLNDNIAVSLGYFDDACDGIVEVKLALDGRELTAKARVCAGPPALVPDALFVRSLVDDLEQVIHGPHVSSEEPEELTRGRAQDIVRRAFETVRFMNVAVMNGNDFKGRSALLLDSMPEEEAADTERALRPVMAPGTVDTLAIMALHEQVYAALRAGTAAWFLRLLRQPEEAADFTDRGRRKMPALMCGADNNYLALTYRQIDTIRKAAHQPSDHPDAVEDPGFGKLTPRNLSAHINFEAAGNPISSRPITSVANCCPGLEVDFRAVWRRMFKGLVLREYDSLVVEVDDDCDADKRFLKGHRLLRVRPPHSKPIPVVTQFKGPASSDPDNEIILTTNMNPAGLAALEWSNALAHVLSGHQGGKVVCDFTKEEAWELADVREPLSENPKNYVSVEFEVRHFFDDDTAVISTALAQPGELTQGLCSPWQNDYRECSCYYWASARPDYVNVEPTATGMSNGDNWLQKTRTGDYVPDDYSDTRLILYDDLFRVSPFSTFSNLRDEEKPLDWERWLRFQVGGRDVTDPPAEGGTEIDT
jgi:hypothetical protein